MIDRLEAELAHARRVPVDERAAFARALAGRAIAGTLVIETCHRVEVYGRRSVLDAVVAPAPPGSRRVTGADVARHLVRLAVGQESAVVGEDQVLHQLRAGVHAARRLGQLPPELDRLADIAMSAGRRARSWLPRRRSDLPSVALARLAAAGWALDGPVLIVGAGQMGRLAARAARAGGLDVVVTSRTPERARALAEELGLAHVAFDPGPALAGRLAGALIALDGRWPIAPATARSLVDGRSWLVDLSAPPAVDPGLRARLHGRLLTIDDLAVEEALDGTAGVSAGLRERLDTLVEHTLAGHAAWLDGATTRDVARALAERAEQQRATELAALWQRLPTLDPAARQEVERMAEHLTRRLLREPLERLRDDGDGRQANAARDFFGL